MSENPCDVLIVDDSPEDRTAYRRFLSRGGGEYVFREAETGEAGLAAWRARVPDVVLLDVHLPELDGLELLGLLGEDERRGTAIIVLTGRGNEEIAAAALRRGAQDYLVKGAIDGELLRHAVTNACEKVGLRQAVERQARELAQANAALQRMYTELEELVRLRTAELSRANDELKHEIAERQQAERERAAMLERELSARAEAERANRAKDEFLGTVSHELRTPLNAILGWAHLLRSGRLDAAETARALEIVERNARIQAQIISELLDVSRITTGKLRLDLARVAVRDVVASALGTMRPAAQAKGLDLVANVQDDLGVVAGDADRLQQVVCNLLSNAIKFTPPQGRVEVEASSGPDTVRLCVSDTGEGIEPAFLPHVFERFRQADGSSTRKHGGLGIGLSIVRHIVEAHGGRVVVESGGPGRGAAFTVTLPRARPGAAMPEEVRAGGSDVLRDVRVLVVEDEDDTREALRRILEERGARVSAARDAGEALAAFDRERPDVLVSDVGLPGMDGYALIARVRARGPAAGGDVPALAITAYAREEDRAKALASGFSVHIGKPVDPAKLVHAVARLAEARSA